MPTLSLPLNSFLGGSFLLFKPFETIASSGSFSFLFLFSEKYVYVFRELTARHWGVSLKVSSSEALLTAQVAQLSGILSLTSPPHHCVRK